MKFDRTAREIEEPVFDLTPMIDIIMLLIVFFMLTAQFSKVLLSYMDLPAEPGAKSTEQRPSQVVIDLLRDGSTRLDNEPMEHDRLLQIVAADLKKAKDVDVLVRADRACPATFLNRLASGLAAVGVRDWKLATAKTGGGA